MANISRIKLDETTYEIKDAQAARASDLALKQDALTAGNGIAIDNSDVIRTTGIPFGTCDSTSTSKVFTATVPGIYKLEDGVCCIIKNGVVTSESGFTLNVNGLGAKPSYSNMATGNDVTPTDPTRDTTIFNINYAMLFVYSSTIVDGGGWICYRGYDANTNTIGYQLRHNSSTLPASDKFYRYRLLFTSADGTKYVPANTSSSTNGTASRTVNLRPIDPFGEILYYSSTTAVNAGANPAATVLWDEYVLNLGYSFNRTGSALVLTYPKPVYIKCAPQTDGSAIIDEDTPYVQALPSSADVDHIYIFLGIAYSATNIELLPNHPVYYHDGTGIRLWVGKKIPTKVSELTNDSGFITSSSLNGLASTSYVDTKVAGVVNSAPETLDTLNELATALGNDPNFATTITTQLGNKVDKETGKSLMTDAERTKLQGIATGAEVNVQPNWTQTNTSADDYIKNKPNLATVATSGSYDDLSDKPIYLVTLSIDNNDQLTSDKDYDEISEAIQDGKLVIVEFSKTESESSSYKQSFRYSAFISSQDINAIGFTALGVGSNSSITTLGCVKSGTETIWSIGDIIIPRGVRLNGTSYNTNTSDGYIRLDDVLPTVAITGSYNDLTNRPTIPTAATSAPLMDGTAAIGSSSKYAKEDHVHPSDTSKMSTSHPANTITNAKISQWDNAGKPFIANLIPHLDENDSLDYYTCNKTYAELCAAIDAGRQVYLYEDEFYGVQLEFSRDGRLEGDSFIEFNGYTSGLEGNTFEVNIFDDNRIEYHSWRYANSLDVVNKTYPTSYSLLVTKRNNSLLTAGQWYRITDYTCTTTQTDTQSAGHQFDILVQATSPNTLSEEAKAIRHEGDTYFANSNFEDWKIWYCLDNDTQRFAWADATNGKGVIYRMIDEHNNDCPYDFKNIQFKRDLTDGELDTENGTTTWVYTFNLWHTAQELYFDASIIGNTLKNDEGFVIGVYNNRMGVVNSYEPYYGSGYDKTNFVLPNNVFLTIGEDGDYNGCFSNTFGNNCFSNTFGNNCFSNTFGKNCSQNTFGYNCSYNIFGSSCSNNKFGYDCYLNTFGETCSQNTFRDNCTSNTFGNSCRFNTFGKNCSSNTFDSSCYSNMFGNEVNSSKFGNSCSSNTFGNNCSNNTFGNYCYSNTLGNNCSSNTFGNACGNNIFSKAYTQYVIVENGNKKITLTSTQTPTSSNRLYNITIAQGVNNTDTTKTISHNTLNDTFRTTYTVDDNGDIYAITPTKYDEWDNKQSALVSGTNIKTINNQSLLGSGNLTASDIGATTRFVVDFTLSGTTISNPNKTFLEIKAAYDAGNLVLARDDAESLYYLLYCETTSCGFFCCDSTMLYDISVDSSNNWTYHETNISQMELDLSDKSQIIYMQKVNNVWKKVTYNDVTGAWLVTNTTLTTGNTKNIYLDRDNSDLYYWNGSAFTLLSGDKILPDWDLDDNTQVDYIKNKPNIPVKISDLSDDKGILTEEDISVLTLGSGTVDINVGSNVYTVDLNHTHSQYLKYELLANESAYLALATKDSSTLYLIPES